MRQSQNVAEQGEMQCFDNSPSHPSPSHNNHHSTHGENSDIISKIQIWKWERNKMTLNSCTYQQFFPATSPRSWQMDAKLTFLVSSYPNPVIFGICGTQGFEFLCLTGTPGHPRMITALTKTRHISITTTHCCQSHHSTHTSSSLTAQLDRLQQHCQVMSSLLSQQHKIKW